MQLTVRGLAQILGVEPCFAGTISETDRERAYEICLTGAAIDSRAVKGGDLFVCLAGEKADGHDFADKACRAGAQALLASRMPQLSEETAATPVFCVENVEKAFGSIAAAVRAQFAGRVIGVTGTAGKTTLKEWLSSLLSMSMRCAKSEGNHNNQLGLPLSVCNTRGDEDVWVMEAGVSHPGDMEELAAILRPDIGIVLNAGTGHTEGLGAMGVAWHKTRMFTLLAPGGIAVAGGNYPDLREKAAAACKEAGVPLHVFSVAGSQQEYRTFCTSGGTGCMALVDARNPALCHLCARREDRVEETLVTMPMAGPAAAENLACITLVASLLRLDLCDLQKALQAAVVPGHRYARQTIGRHVLIDDSYNANPLSMERMIAAAGTENAVAGRRLVAVLGAMLELGDEAEAAHTALGRCLAAHGADCVLWKGPYADAVRAGYGSSAFAVFATDEECVAHIEGVLAPPAAGSRGLTILCKGSRSNHLETAASAISRLLKASAED